MSIKGAVLLLFLTVAHVGAVVPPTTVWQIMPEATAGNVNAGNFDPACAAAFPDSIDYSTFAAAVLSASDWAIDPALNNVVTTVSSVTHAMVCNGLHITAGTGFNIISNNSWHIITAIDGSGKITLYDSAGVVGSNLGTGKIGGGLSMNSILDNDVFASRNSSNTFWWHGPVTTGESINQGSTGTTLYPVNHYGWNVTRGDNPDMSTAPTINYAAQSFTVGNYENFYNLNITGSVAGGMALATGNIVKNVKLANTSAINNRPALTVNGQCKIVQDDFSSANGPGLTISNTNDVVDRCFIHDSSNGIVTTGFDFQIITRNLFAIINSTALSLAAGSIGNRIEDNTFFGTQTVATGRGIGIWARDGTSGDNYITRNNFIGFSTAVYFQDAAPSNFADYNNYYGNVLNMSSAAPTGLNDISVNPNFVDWIHYNFTPQNTALNKTYGYSNTSSSTTLTIGAIQIPSSSGGGTRGTVYIK